MTSDPANAGSWRHTLTVLPTTLFNNVNLPPYFCSTLHSVLICEAVKEYHMYLMHYSGEAQSGTASSPPGTRTMRKSAALSDMRNDECSLLCWVILLGGG